jgi:hypothetical protein
VSGVKLIASIPTVARGPIRRNDCRLPTPANLFLCTLEDGICSLTKARRCRIDDLGEVRSRLERLETAVVRRVNLSEGYALGSSESVGWVNLMDHLGPESAIDVEFSDSVGPRGSFTADSRLVVRGDDGNEK